MEPAFDTVHVDNVTKLFGRTAALTEVTLALRAGQIAVIEGPNGSGKSTLLGLLAQLARPTRGQIRYGDLVGSAARSRIGLLGHASMLYPDLTGVENLELFASLHRRPPARVDALRARFGLARFAERPVRTCSRGQQQRLALARALLSEPALLLLDEPSTGLDTRGVDELVRAVEAERERGAIVALVTHDGALAERLGDRRVRLERGRVVTMTEEHA